MSEKTRSKDVVTLVVLGLLQNIEVARGKEREREREGNRRTALSSPPKGVHAGRTVKAEVVAGSCCGLKHTAQTLNHKDTTREDAKSHGQ